MKDGFCTTQVSNSLKSEEEEMGKVKPRNRVIAVSLYLLSVGGVAMADNYPYLDMADSVAVDREDFVREVASLGGGPFFVSGQLELTGYSGRTYEVSFANIKACDEDRVGLGRSVKDMSEEELERYRQALIYGGEGQALQAEPNEGGETSFEPAMPSVTYFGNSPISIDYEALDGVCGYTFLVEPISIQSFTSSSLASVKLLNAYN